MDQYTYPLNITVLGNSRKATWNRRIATDALQMRGAFVSSRVTQVTDLLVVVGRAACAETRKAFNLRKAGHRIMLPNDYDNDMLFLDPEGFCRTQLNQAIRDHYTPVAEPEVAAPVPELPLQMSILPAIQWQRPSRFQISL